jgi:two-component system OmpR family sensor kinase
MPGIDWLRRYWVEVAWGAFATLNVVSMAAWPSWETIPFHFLWISLTLVYGFRVWRLGATAAVLGVVAAATGAAISVDAFDGIQLWGELFEVPLMAAMFLAMVWHARRRLAAMRGAESIAASQERLMHDVSHELRTPVTIALGHLDLHRRRDGESAELAVVGDELRRMDRLISRLLLLAQADQPAFLTRYTFAAEIFLEDVFLRWAEVAPRGWRLGHLEHGTLRADPEAVRIALDALLENALKYTDERDTIELRSSVLDYGLVIEVADTGVGISPDASERIFERFARGDDARARETGGVGLGLSIVDAVAKAHGGSCTVRPRNRGTVFALRLPDFAGELDAVHDVESPQVDPVTTPLG